MVKYLDIFGLTIWLTETLWNPNHHTSSHLVVCCIVLRWPKCWANKLSHWQLIYLANKFFLYKLVSATRTNNFLPVFFFFSFHVLNSDIKCKSMVLVAGIYSPHYQTCKKSRPVRPAVGGNFQILGKFGEILHSPIRELSYFPTKNFPIGKISHVPSGELLSNKQTYKIRLFMWLLQETNEMLHLKFTPFLGKFQF